MIFGELDHRLSVVKRWGTVQTIRQQSVAEHSYNVAIIAERIAYRLFPSGYLPDKGERIFGAVLTHALHHDRRESITGDLPSYAKPYFDETAMINSIPAWKYDRETEIGEGSAGDIPWIKFIVKCADYIDACVFLRMEVSLGNRSVSYHLHHLEARFRNYLAARENDLSADCAKVYTWYQEDVVDGMFGGNGQYVSEIDGFPKR